MREEFRQRLAQEFRYIANKMHAEDNPAKKLYYFSALFGDAQRVLNLEWDRDLLLVHIVFNHAYAQIDSTLQGRGLHLFPINWESLFSELTQIADDVATNFEKVEDDTSKEELHTILGRCAEIAYAVSGNGAYLQEKGTFNLSSTKSEQIS